MATASSQTAGPVRATITLDYEEHTKLRSDLETERINRRASDKQGFKYFDEANHLRTEKAELLGFVRQVAGAYVGTDAEGNEVIGISHRDDARAIIAKHAAQEGGAR